jgi:O-antigen ligase
MVWTEKGLQGLIAFLWLLVAVIWQARRWLLSSKVDPHLTALGAAFLSGYAAHLVHMRSESFAGRPQMQMLWFLIAMVVVIDRLITEASVQSTPEKETSTARLGWSR